MLQLLHIENVAVIERADIQLDKGLTVLSGETGAGKSIVIDSVGAILGRRVSRDLVRSGARKGFVSAVFTDIPEALKAILEELELSCEEEDTLIIQRQITADGKSSCRVNMKPATQAVLRQLAPYLIDIHGQNDGQKLLDEQHHIDYLDGYAENGAILSEYLPKYRSLLALRKEITDIETGEQERFQRLDMLSFHHEEIESAQLKPGEDETLAQRKAYFDHAGKIISALGKARQMLDGDDEVQGACALLLGVSNEILGLHELSEAFDKLYEQAEEVRCLASDLRDGISRNFEGTDFSVSEQELVEQRLDEIYRLKQKYGSTIEEILSYNEKITLELETLKDSDNRKDELRKEYKKELAEAKGLAAKLTESRKEAAVKLEKAIVEELKALDMDKVRMRIAVHTGHKLSSHGFDTVTFEISVNPGEPEKPLSKVASGGELSRIMLALKNVLTSGEDVGMLIFDEIDTGVSGHAAQQIAKKLSDISKKKQTLCVTHLPQIAAMGDHHLLISKTVKDGRSYTSVAPMDHEERVNEVARLLSGDRISEAARKNAEELLSG